MGSNDSKIAIFAATLAFFGAVAGTFLTGQIHKYQWEREVTYKERKSLLSKRLDLLERTSALLNKSSYAEMLTKEIEYWKKSVDLNKVAILAKIKGKDDSEPVDLVEAKDILDGFRQARGKLIILSSEYASTMQLNAVFFGSKTREAIRQIEAQENWWGTNEDTKKALIGAMYEELTIFN